MGKNKRIVESSYTTTIKRRIIETDNKKCLISLEKVIDNKDYGLCLDKKHTQTNSQNSKKFNTALLGLFHFLCKRTWNEIYQTIRQQEYGHKHLLWQDIQAESIKTYFIDKCGKSKNDKIDIFRFGSQEFRACGFRQRQTDIFYLVCIDYNHSLYNHGS